MVITILQITAVTGNTSITSAARQRRRRCPVTDFALATGLHVSRPDSAGHRLPSVD